MRFFVWRETLFLHFFLVFHSEAANHFFGTFYLFGLEPQPHGPHKHGYKQQAGGGWSGDLLVVDWEEMFGASSLDSIHLKTLKAKEVTPILNKDQNGKESWRFPCATGALRQPGFDQIE